MVPDNYVYYFADDALLVLPGQAPLRSKAEIKKMFESLPQVRGFEDKWDDKVNIISMSTDGQLAYSFDQNEMHIPDSSGHFTIQKNNGLHVWKKDANGEWRVGALLITPRVD